MRQQLELGAVADRRSRLIHALAHLRQHVGDVRRDVRAFGIEVQRDLFEPAELQLGIGVQIRAQLLQQDKQEDLGQRWRLHAEEGRGKDEQPGLSRFRLISESIPGGLGLGALFYSQSAPRPAYKLFEIVPGAQLEVTGKPGETVVAQVRLETNQGRKPARFIEEGGGEGLQLQSTVKLKIFSRGG